MAGARTVSVSFLGNTSDLEAALTRAGIVAEDTSKKIQGSAAAAGRAAQEQARVAGASATEQEAAAARAAAGYTEMAAKISGSQRAAGNAAVAAARTVGASLDEQRAAYTKAIATQGEYEAALKRTADVARASAAEQAAAANKAAAEIEAAHARQAKSAAKMAATVGKWSLGAGVASGYFAVKGATQLQSRMEQLHTQAGISQQRVNQQTQDLYKMAPGVATGPNELSLGLFHADSALNKTLPAVGKNTAELHALQIAAEGAKVGGADLVTTQTALDAALVSGIKGTKNYSDVMGTLNAAVGAGSMHMQDMADFLSNGVLGPMSTYGVSLKDVAGAAALLADNNIKGEQAATKFASAMRIMAAPTAAASKALNVIGLSTTQLGDTLRHQGLSAAIDELKAHLKDSGLNPGQQGEVITRAFGGRQSTAVQLMIAQNGRLRASIQQVGDTSKHFGTDWAAYTHTFQYQLDKLGASAQVTGDKFGMTLIPELEGLMHTTSDVIGWVDKHKGVEDALAITIGGVLSAAVATFAYTKAVAFVNATKGMIGGVRAVGSAIGGMGTKLEEWGTMNASTTTAIEAENTAAGASFTTMGTEASAATAGIDAKMAEMVAAVSAGDSEIETANAAAGASFARISGAAGALLTKLGPLAIAYAGYESVKATGLFSASTWGSGGPKNSAPLPKAGETERAWLTQNSGLKTYSGPLTAAGIDKARADQGFPAQKSLIAELFKQMASQGHFGRHGFVPSTGTTGTAPGSLALPGVTNSATTANPAQMVAFFQKALGLTKAQAAGIAGNIQVESAGTFAGNIVQGGSRASTIAAGDAKGTGGGYGLAQWTDSGRQANLAALAKQMGLPQDSVKVQEAFIVQELKGSYASALQNLKGTSTAAQAATVIQNEYEGPASLTASLAQRQQDATTLSGGGTVTPASGSSPGHPSASTLAAYNALTGGASAGGGKAVMRYYKHQPVGVMTPAQWQAWQAQNGVQVAGQTVATRQGSAETSISTTVGGDVTRYQDLASSASTGAIRHLYSGVAEAIQDLGPKFEAEAKSASTTTGEAKVRDALRLALAGITEGVAARVKLLAQATADATRGTSLIGKYQNAAQSGTSRTLENSLGINTSQTIVGPDAGYAPGGSRPAASTPIASTLYAQIESGRSIAGTLRHASTGEANTKYQQDVSSLRATGQDKLADKLVAAHSAAMRALEATLIAEQETKDGKELDQQATALKDQTTAIQNAMQNAQTVFQATEQKASDASAAVVQGMQDQQTIMDDMAASVVKSMADAAQIKSDQSQTVVDAINDQTQTQVDQIGEKGLYGLALVAQQDKVIADQTKQKWDQILDTDKQNLDVAKANADVAESAAQLNLDQVTATEHAAVAIAQGNLDTVTLAQDVRVAAAQAKDDAAHASADTTLIGPAQIAVDMNANSSKAVQEKMQAQLAKATGQADKSNALADKQLALTQTDAQNQIQIAQKQYDATDIQATQLIQAASDNVSSTTDAWNLIIQKLNDTLTGDQGSAGIAEAGANSTAAIAGANASTQFAGSGLTIIQYGVDLSSPDATGQSTGWAIRQAGIQVT